VSDDELEPTGRSFDIGSGNWTFPSVVSGGTIQAPLKIFTSEVAVPAPRCRKLFVAYPYSIPKAYYRRPFNDLADACDVQFLFADEKITNKQILDKIADMIMTARFSLFDITMWKPNVALELGIANGSGRDYYLLFNPTHAVNPKGAEMPSDPGGRDRLEYTSFSELEERLTKLLVQEFGVRRANQPADPVAAFRKDVPELIREKPGLKMREIASELGVPVQIAQVVVYPLVGSVLETTGVKKGTRYYLPGAAPKS
jgi:hypothetical protein